LPADLRHNGKLYIIVSGRTVSVLLGNNDGTFSRPPTMFSVTPVWRRPTSMAMQHRRHWQSASFVEMLKGNGNGTLQGSIDYVATRMGLDQHHSQWRRES